MLNFTFHIIIQPISNLIHEFLKIGHIQTLSTVEVPVDSTLYLTVLKYYLDELVHLPMS